MSGFYPCAQRIPVFSSGVSFRVNLMGYAVLETKSGLHTNLIMRQDVMPTGNPDFVLAMKHLFDRELIRRALFRGYGTIGNDHPEHDMIARESEGALTVTWSPEGFAEAILWCLAHPGEARAMGLRGRGWVGEHRTYDRLADMVYRKLAEVVGGSPAGRGSGTPVAGDAGAR